MNRLSKWRGEFRSDQVRDLHSSLCEAIRPTDTIPFVYDQHRIEPCSHPGPCEPGVCSCIDDGIFCSKHCHCVHDECKIFFPGCQCPRGRCRTKACPCFCAGRECDIDLCKLCSADEIVAREKDGPYHSHSDDTTKDGRNETTCQNRSIALGKQKHVRMGRSKLSAAGWGLFVDDFVAKDEFIIEYIGEMVSQKEADRRGAVYDKVDRRYDDDFGMDNASMFSCLHCVCDRFFLVICLIWIPKP